jgi:hypothetical protein
MALSAVSPSTQAQQITPSSSPHRPTRGQMLSTSDVDAQSTGQASNSRPAGGSLRTLAGHRIDISA